MRLTWLDVGKTFLSNLSIVLEYPDPFKSNQLKGSDLITGFYPALGFCFMQFTGEKTIAQRAELFTGSVT